MSGLKSDSQLQVEWLVAFAVPRKQPLEEASRLQADPSVLAPMPCSEKGTPSATKYCRTYISSTVLNVPSIWAKPSSCDMN